MELTSRRTIAVNMVASLPGGVQISMREFLTNNECERAIRHHRSNAVTVVAPLSGGAQINMRRF